MRVVSVVVAIVVGDVGVEQTYRVQGNRGLCSTTLQRGGSLGVSQLVVS